MQIFSVFFHPASNFTALGGAEKRFIEVLKVWNDAGVRITVVEPSPSLVPKYCDRCEVVEMAGPLPYSARSLFAIYLEWLLWLIKACLLCPSLLKRKNYDIILAPNNTLPNLIVTYLLRIISGLPMLVIVHHLDFPSTSERTSLASIYRVYRKARFSLPVTFSKTITFFIILAVLRRSNMCIAVSNHTARFLIKNSVMPHKVRVSGNGVDTNLIERFKVNRKLYAGVFVGRIARDKGVFDLVKIWKTIVSCRPGSKLLIIGSGPDSVELKKMTDEHDLSSHILLRGNCSDSELYTQMKASKIFLFPSMFEGWGLAVGEALACGLPVVCYNIPALCEIFGSCKSVFFVSVGDILKFAETVEEVLENGDLEELKRTSIEYVKRFNWKEVASNDLKVIKIFTTAQLKPRS